MIAAICTSRDNPRLRRHHLSGGSSAGSEYGSSPEGCNASGSTVPWLTRRPFQETNRCEGPLHSLVMCYAVIPNPKYPGSGKRQKVLRSQLLPANAGRYRSCSERSGFTWNGNGSPFRRTPPKPASWLAHWPRTSSPGSEGPWSCLTTTPGQTLNSHAYRGNKPHALFPLCASREGTTICSGNALRQAAVWGCGSESAPQLIAGVFSAAAGSRPQHRIGRMRNCSHVPVAKQDICESEVASRSEAVPQVSKTLTIARPRATTSEPQMRKKGRLERW